MFVSQKKIKKMDTRNKNGTKYSSIWENHKQKLENKKRKTKKHETLINGQWLTNIFIKKKKGKKAFRFHEVKKHTTLSANMVKIF